MEISAKDAMIPFGIGTSCPISPAKRPIYIDENSKLKVFVHTEGSYRVRFAL